MLRSKAAKVDPWLIALRGRRPRLVVAVALANKMARIAWAIMRQEGNIPIRAGDGITRQAAAQPQACEGNKA